MKTGSWFRSTPSSTTSQIPYIMGLFISFGGGAMYGYSLRKEGEGQRIMQRRIEAIDGQQDKYHGYDISSFDEKASMRI